MSTPVVLAVLSSIQTAIQGISVGSGYNYTLKATSVVLDPEQLELTPATERPFIVCGVVIPGTRKYVTAGNPPAFGDEFTVLVSFVIDVAGGTDKTRKVTAGWKLLQDLEVAIAKDPQRGGVAQWTEADQPTLYPGSGQQNSVYGELPVRVRLVRQFGHP
jgi:hypothetical protein